MALKWRGDDLFLARYNTDGDIKPPSSSILTFLHPMLCANCQGMYFDFCTPQPDTTTLFEYHESVGEYRDLELRASAGCQLCSFVRSALLLEAQRDISTAEWPLAQNSPVSILYGLPLRSKLLSQAESGWLPLVLVLKSNDGMVHTVDTCFQTDKSTYRIVNQE
jgi:hypothetical protein